MQLIFENFNVGSRHYVRDKKTSLIRTMKIGFEIAPIGFLLWAATAGWGKAVQSIGVPIWTIAIFLLAFLALSFVSLRRALRDRLVMDQPLQAQTSLKAGALQDAIFISANFSSAILRTNINF